MTPLRALAASAVLLLAAGCTGNSAAMITVTGDKSISLATLEVGIRSHDGKHEDRFTVPEIAVQIPFMLPKTISVTFPSSVSSYLDVCVDGRLADRLVATGAGFSTSPIVKGGITEVTVPLTLVPQGGVGCGGAPDLGGGVPDMGGGD